MNTNLKILNKIDFYHKNQIKVKIFLKNKFKYEGIIKELLDEYQFVFDDKLKGEDILEYDQISNVVKSYE